MFANEIYFCVSNKLVTARHPIDRVANSFLVSQLLLMLRSPEGSNMRNCIAKFEKLCCLLYCYICYIALGTLDN